MYWSRSFCVLSVHFSQHGCNTSWTVAHRVNELTLKWINILFHAWGSIDPVVVKFIFVVNWCTSLKMVCNSKTASCKAKHWTMGLRDIINTRIYWIPLTFSFEVIWGCSFEVILGCSVHFPRSWCQTFGAKFSIVILATVIKEFIKVHHRPIFGYCQLRHPQNFKMLFTLSTPHPPKGLNIELAFLHLFLKLPYLRETWPLVMFSVFPRGQN